MRVFHIQPDGRFNEYMQTPFADEHQEAVLEDWLESNSECILDDGGILIIGRQESTDLGGSIDLLGLDREGNVVVIELKRERTPRSAIAQALEYASFAEGLDTQQLESTFRSYRKEDSLVLAECHRSFFNLSTDEAVSYNKDQRIVIVGEHITAGIKQTAAYLNKKGVHLTCLEFTFFQDSQENRLMTQQAIVDDEEGGKPFDSPGTTETSREEFLAACDDNGKHVFSCILAFADNSPLQIHWHTKGFSLKLLIEGTHVPVIYGYSPETWLGQTLYTFLFGVGGTAEKANLPEEIVQRLHNHAHDFGFLELAGMNLKCLISRKLLNEEIDSLLAWCESVEKAISEYGLKS